MEGQIKLMKVASVILGALLGGFMWRCRGESGWGSSWGMYCVAFVLMLLIYNFYGKHRGMKIETLLLGSFFAGLGVTGYATIIEQPAGLLYSCVPCAGELVKEAVLTDADGCIYTSVNPYSGLLIFFLMGVTLIPLFSFLVSSLFSDKEYTFKHYAVMTVIFFGVSYICKATIAHPVLSLINPEQVEYAAKGLASCGFDYSSPMKAYMAHFGSRSWAEEIPFFENYYMSVEHISDAVSVVAISLYALIVRKDKVTFAGTLFISILTGAASTVATFWVCGGYDTGIFANVHLRCLEGSSGWGVWEFSTGFAAGLFIMLFIALLPEEYTLQSRPDTAPLFKNKKINFVFNVIGSVFILALTQWRAIGTRFAKLLENNEIIENKSPLLEIIMIGGTVIFGLWLIVMLKKNTFDRGILPFGVNPCDFSFIALPAIMILSYLLYFFMNHGYVFIFPYESMTSVKNLFREVTTPQLIDLPFSFISFVLAVIIYIPARKKLRQR